MSPAAVVLRLVAVLGLLFIFLLGVKGLGDGFKQLGQETLKAFFTATENPFLGLVVGLLGTTLVQSSSVTTSMIVALVAAPENPLPLANAVPMVMGANIGTTVTNTIVALAHMGRPEEFRRAFSAATCHDFFNYLAVLVLLPVELATGLLQRLSVAIAEGIGGFEGVEFESPLKPLLDAGMTPVKGLGAALFGESLQAYYLIAVAALLIFVTLYALVKNMNVLMRTKVHTVLTRVFGAPGAVAIAIGALVTVMVQSSSITTSLLVPLAGAGVLTLEQAFPITIGANIGTTITALLASLAVSGPNAIYGVEIGLVHLLFNLLGMLIVYPLPATRRLPIGAARRLADLAIRSRPAALAYVFGLFYGVPALLVFLSRYF